MTVNDKRAISEKYPQIYIDDVNYQSINCHYDLNFKLDNKTLYYLLLEEKENINIKELSYKPNKFAGLKVKFHKVPEKYKGSVCIFFQSGKVNIYGSSSEEEIAFVYSVINKLMDKCYLKIKRV